MSETQDDKLLLGHEYDGIQELDNELPRWWLYGFYFTIAFAFVYMIYYHASGLGPNPDQEFLAQMADAGYRIPQAAIKDVTSQDLLLGVVGLLSGLAAIILGELFRADRPSKDTSDPS